jgi:MFS family permease
VHSDPRDVLLKSPMTSMQVFIIAITIGLNALDGFDVTSISFAGPGIAADWGINRAVLGFVLSAELVGMAIGSIFLGGVADKIGRRRTMLGCLVVMALGMFMVTTTNGVLGSIFAPFFTFLTGLFGNNPVEVRLADLAMWRVITGLGIGGMLAAINAVAAEFSNQRRRDLSVSLMAIGYPIGAVVGGTIASELLRIYDWQAVFYFGAAVTAIFIPLVYFFVPESVHWLAHKQPEGALEQINRTLKRLGHTVVSALPAMTAETRKRSSGDIFRAGLLMTTVLVTAAYFFHITTFYFILKWVPNIVASMGFDPSSSGYILVWTNVGGATGGAVIGFLSLRYSVKALTITTMLLSTVMVTLFGRTAPDLLQLAMICCAAGFMTNGAIVGMYALFARAFPTHVRAFGTGFAIGLGRGGSVLAPILAGFLFTWGFELPGVAMTMAFGSFCAAVVLSLLKLKPEQPEVAAPGTREREPAITGAVAHGR